MTPGPSCCDAPRTSAEDLASADKRDVPASEQGACQRMPGQACDVNWRHQAEARFQDTRRCETRVRENALVDSLRNRGRIGPSMRAPSVVLFGVLLTSPAFAASFDCARASTPREKAICASPRLSQLDDQLAAEYTKLLATVSTEVRATVRQNERDWLHSVECPANLGREALGDCLAIAWDKRVRLLQATISSARQPGGVPFVWNSVHFTRPDTGDEASNDAQRGAPQYSTLDAEWPQALSSDPGWQAWNRAIELEARDLASQGQAQHGDPWAKSDWMDGMDNDVSVTLGDITPVFVGASFQNLWYGHGAIHPNYVKLQFNWLLPQRRELAPEMSSAPILAGRNSSMTARWSR